MTQLLAGGGLFVCLALIIYLVAAQVEERSTVRASLRQLDEYQIENVRDRVLLDPLGTRLNRPVLGALLGIGRRFWPSGYSENVRRKLIIAGRPEKEAHERFLALRVL